MAGDSARESARRQRDKAERLLRSAELWERGAEGEEATGSRLATLDPARWTVLHDLRWPGRRWANIDHVVVGPPGVFVIDSKNWSGRISVTEHVLRQNGRSREKAVAGAADAALAVAAELRSIDVRRVYPVLCFARDERIAGWARDVIVCSTGNIAEMLTSRPSSVDAATCRIAAQELKTLGQRLENRTPTGHATAARGSFETRRAGRPPTSHATRGTWSPSPPRRSTRRDMPRLILFLVMVYLLISMANTVFGR